MRKIIKSYIGILLSPSFIFGILGVCILFLIDSGMPMFQSEYMWNVQRENYDVMYKIIGIIFWGNYMPFLLILSTIGFGLQFCKEWNQGVVPWMVKGWGLKKYSFYYVCMGAVSGGGISALGVIVYILYMNRHLLLVNSKMVEHNSYNYIYTLSDNGGVGYMVIIVALMFVTGALAGVIALSFSTITTNKYLIMIIPYIIYNIYVEGAKILGIPNEFRIDYYLFGRNDIGNSYESTLLIMVWLMFFIILVGYILFKKGLRRRLHYEKY